MLRLVCCCSVWLIASLSLAAEPETFDLVIYGGNSGGVAAAIQTARMGKSVVLIEPSQHVGGLTSGGLGATDIGNKAAIGGISREFYQRVKQHYEQPENWSHEQREQYSNRKQNANEDTMWFFEPQVAEKIYRAMLAEHKVPVVYGERLDLKSGVKKQGARIASITMESGRSFAGRRFIDASYEGDLLAKAGVSYHVGREANATYQETLNGVQVKQATKHQLMVGVDPYVKKGDKSSGLLPGVHGDGPGAEGAGDRRVQAYNFRMCVTDVADNRLPFEKPAGYDEARYELLFRDFEAGETRAPWNPIMMPNRKTDANNNFGFASDNIGMNYAYPEGDYATREKIFQDHLLYQRGLMWTLANHARVPEKLRREFSRWGNCKDEFPEHHGWSHQLYIREARRMIGEYVMTQHNCQGRQKVDDAVGLAAYTMDSHHTQRYVNEQGHAWNEGDVQVGGFPPYAIAYRSIVPKASECENLLVPVCLSASHIAYGSIRMEPVFMVLGQSAATAAVQSLEGDIAVQKIAIDKLRQRLLEDKQVLEWQGGGGSGTGIAIKSLAGLVLDDEALTRKGEWLASQSISGFVGTQYWHDNNVGQGEKEARFTGRVAKSGKYDVRLAYSANGNRASNVKINIEHAGGTTAAVIDQRKAPPIDKAFISLGTYMLSVEKPVVVTVSNQDANGHVIADAIWIVEAK
ncbi:MAG TPA: FAD-dependent oxidoreductase [Pirellulaceae bacterium]|nr:FAD-dependent oxidoreductase [Pirellulaceae bacterium]